ncbi:hypothetical protein A2960_03230 [Candidatus Gottesmanbacteria bacterium RIFCSPLOWO2_01_FULL_39_12b]|uniref:Nucleotidyl transferase domain-containing protein n=1 Tax=Candidatus Gottesmanbacteria bacterium RIFCSPLOWO2_01_FULL_39_12b TaxID=1798388 RepID=A0A1F6AR84_9BACT|nr:MAG: hypothetical protein A2960_03230 [Candidatus Gottesmanbacteria bacterium RIFCSPLOWO2_01_FULL_39_12b]
MQVIIVAGGRGERLRPLTDRFPKPMLKVGGIPILEDAINFFKKNKMTDFILALSYKSEIITGYFGRGEKWGVKIRYLLPKDTPLGTAGDIILARNFIKDTFIVTYGDILRELDVAQVIKSHKKNKAFGTIVIYNNKNKHPKSLIRFDESGRVSEFLERPKIHETKQSEVWSNGSFYIFEPQIFNYIPVEKRSDFAYDIFPKIISLGKRVYAYKQKGFFIDIGSKAKLDQARRIFKI